MSDYEHLIYEQRGPVTIITINRPDRMNAIGPQTHRELVDAWGRFRADDASIGNGHRPLAAESPEPTPAVDNTSQSPPRKAAPKKAGKPPEPAQVS
jgi:hypothetical protein